MFVLEGLEGGFLTLAMPKIFKRFKMGLLFLMLLSVSARVFTGASEAQVNFTSIIVDQHLAATQEVNHELLLHEAEISSSENASSIPDKHRTYSTYKKYVTPDKYFEVTLTPNREATRQHSAIGYVTESHIHTSIFLPLANSPPAVVSAHSHTHTTTSGSPVVTENNFGEIAINYSAGGLGSFQL
jgi:hypothetical protein